MALPLLFTTLVACDGVSGREARGRLDLSGTSHHADQLIAVDDLGRREVVELEADGSFNLALDEGRNYAIAFSDSESRRRGALAQLVFKTEDGWRSKFHVGAGPTVELGLIRPISREMEIEIEIEHPENEVGDDDGGRRRDCRDLSDDGTIDVLPSFLVVGDAALSTSDDDAGLDDGQLRDQDDDLSPDPLDDDRDGDGLCDDDPSDGGTNDGDAGVPDAEDGGDDGDDDDRADLPYDIRPAIGDTVQLSSVFLDVGPAPARILSVEMEAPAWRFEELSSDTPFVVTEADCAHEGNRDVGRDRIYVAWENTDGSREIDHLDLRYCKN